MGCAGHPAAHPFLSALVSKLGLDAANIRRTQRCLAVHSCGTILQSAMKSPLSLSVIIPVYNEIELVDRQVRRMDAFMAVHVADHELIIIESGSTDGSSQACDRLARELPRVRLIHEGARNGYGAAIRLGFAQATKDLLISIPVDLPFPLDVLPEGLRLVE